MRKRAATALPRPSPRRGGAGRAFSPRGGNQKGEGGEKLRAGKRAPAERGAGAPRGGPAPGPKGAGGTATGEKTGRLPTAGAKVAATRSRLASASETVITILTDAAAIAAAYHAKDALLSGGLRQALRRNEHGEARDRARARRKDPRQGRGDDRMPGRRDDSPGEGREAFRIRRRGGGGRRASGASARADVPGHPARRPRRRLRAP